MAFSLQLGEENINNLKPVGQYAGKVSACYLYLWCLTPLTHLF